jgi:hypothetical protein
MSAADLTSVPRTGPDVSAIELDGETVLYDGLSQRLIVLNSTASLIWSCCDGARPIDGIIADIAGAYGVARDTIQLEIVELLQRLDAEGLLVRGLDG